ncbi:hypothetical protein Micbo1qcDRAFT_208234 [Microdochium bolleyi]|uniref:Uncharacterized protein n=1 Tax=Microdochium bolleyi TaxID=196109 RepID=A0A136IQK2_9PEZI|nr:hypothetical protein Micbo1qcDRAFT_208234 [Microdochium bolleyi]
MASAADNQALRGFMQAWTIVGFYGTWVRSLLNGTLASIFHALHVSGVLPGTDLALSTTLTGIYWPFDYLLDILILFFCNAVDGSYPPTSVFGLWFAGQHTAVITILYLDCYRSGPKFSWRYLATVVLMALPGEGPRALVSSHLHQALIALWNMFPLVVGASQTALERLVPLWADRVAGDAGGQEEDERVVASRASRRAYALALFITVASHLGLIVLTASAWLFPQLFSPAGIAAVQAGTLWRLPLSHATTASLGPGILQFMQWDSLVGFTALLVQVTTESTSRACTSGWRAQGAVLVVAAAVALGPGSAALLVRWADDEEALAKGSRKTE